MDKLQVFGKADLKGFINIPGAKNAVLPIMACSILSNKSLSLMNVPTFYQLVVSGLILIIAVFLDSRAKAKT